MKRDSKVVCQFSEKTKTNIFEERFSCVICAPFFFTTVIQLISKIVLLVANLLWVSSCEKYT